MGSFDNGFPLPVPDGGGASLINPKIVQLPVYGPVKKGDMLRASLNKEATTTTPYGGERGYSRSIGKVSYLGIYNVAQSYSGTAITEAVDAAVLNTVDGVDTILSVSMIFNYAQSRFDLEYKVFTFDGYTFTPKTAGVLVAGCQTHQSAGLTLRKTSKSGVFVVFYNSSVAWSTYGAQEAAVSINVSSALVVSILCSQTLFSMLVSREGESAFEEIDTDTFLLSDERNPSSYLKVVKYNVGTNTFSVGSQYIFNDGAAQAQMLRYCVLKDKTLVLVWYQGSTWYTRKLTVNGLSLSFGSIIVTASFAPKPILQTGYEDCVVACATTSQVVRVGASSITVVSDNGAHTTPPNEPGKENPPFSSRGIVLRGDSNETLFLDEFYSYYANTLSVASVDARNGSRFLSESYNQLFPASRAISSNVFVYNSAAGRKFVSEGTGRIYKATKSNYPYAFHYNVLAFNFLCDSTLQAMEDQPLASGVKIKCLELNPIGWKGVTE